jgi:hypothetical protein
METATEQIPEHMKKDTYIPVLCFMKNALSIGGLNSFTTRVDILLQWKDKEDRHVFWKGNKLVQFQIRTTSHHHILNLFQARTEGPLNEYC